MVLLLVCFFCSSTDVFVSTEHFLLETTNDFNVHSIVVVVVYFQPVIAAAIHFIRIDESLWFFVFYPTSWLPALYFWYPIFFSHSIVPSQ